MMGAIAAGRNIGDPDEGTECVLVSSEEPRAEKASVYISAHIIQTVSCQKI